MDTVESPFIKNTMMIPSSLQTTLRQQIIAIVRDHAATIEAYVVPSPRQEELVAALCVSLCRLAEIAKTAPENALREQFAQAVRDLEQVQAFLQLMDHESCVDFQNSSIQKMVSEAQIWCQKFQRSRTMINRNDVWDRLTPCTPDYLEELAMGVFEAVWASPIPVMDIEILKRTEGVMLLGEQYEPKILPGGVAVRFSVVD
jgi:hypothetical protein